MNIIRNLIPICVLGAVLFAVNATASVLHVDLNCTNATPPYADWSTAATNIQDAVDASADGDLVLVTNGIYQTGGRVVYGSLTNRVAINKAITVQSVNGSAVTAIQGNPVVGNNAIRCVYMANGSSLSGFTLTNGATMSSGDAHLDQSGGGMWTTNNSSAIISNCVVIKNAAQIYGGGAYYGNIYNCSILQNSSAASGGGIAYSLATNCLVLSNSATSYGGGAWTASLKNCRILNNKAGSNGGGASYSSLFACLVVSNQASQIGGGIYMGQTVVNCTIIGNYSTQGGGGVNGGAGLAFQNNIIYYNAITIGATPNYSGLFSALNCCTTPTPTGNVFSFADNITNEPVFLDFANGDYHLQTNSPCINSGTGSPTTATDLDGNPRLVDRFLDIGAYEDQSSRHILPYQFAQNYSLSLDGTIDSDGDGMNNLQEAIAGTNPTNATSFLKMLSVSNSVSGNTVKWQSIAYKIYYLQRATNLLANPAFVSIYTNISQPFTTLSFKDTMATNGGPYFYRVGVQ
jgi:hypothetical protein